MAQRSEAVGEAELRQPPVHLTPPRSHIPSSHQAPILAYFRSAFPNAPKSSACFIRLNPRSASSSPYASHLDA